MNLRELVLLGFVVVGSLAVARIFAEVVILVTGCK